MDATNLPTIATDLMAVESPQSPQAGRSPSEEAQAEATAQEEFQYGEFDINYILGEGRQSWSSDRASYIDTRARKDAGLGADWGIFGGGRRPSTITVGSDDAFTRQVRNWDDVFAERRVEWSFKCENTDGKGPALGPTRQPEPAASVAATGARSQPSNTMAPNTQEIWRQTFVGRFKVDRMKMQSTLPSRCCIFTQSLRHDNDFR